MTSHTHMTNHEHVRTCFLSAHIRRCLLSAQIHYSFNLSLSPITQLVAMSCIRFVNSAVAQYMNDNVLVLAQDTPEVPKLVLVKKRTYVDPNETPVCRHDVYGIDTNTGYIIIAKEKAACRQLFKE